MVNTYLIRALIHGRKPSKYSRNLEERRLARVLSNYTCESSSTFDPVFDKKIRKLRPDWFKSTSVKKKERLLELAAIPGSKKPNRHAKDEKERKFGSALRRYTRVGGSSFDPVFDKKIRELRPGWLGNTATNRKKELLELAAIPGSRKPTRYTKDEKETKLAIALSSYTHESNGTLDSVFTAKIQELRPDWFRNTATNKKELLELAAIPGSKRPRQRAGKLGSALSNYTCKSSDTFDPIFADKIRELRPDWFRRDK